MTTVSDAVLDRRADLLVDARDHLLEDLVSFRKQHNLSQQTVAERMGVSQPTVAAFERYDANPTVSSIIRYAMAVEALLEIKVIDDCGEGVPATWQMTGAAQTTVRVPTPTRKTQAIADGWSVTQEPAHV
ncbi:helix-turn-helix transcriptional regulator [Schaalia hyovaginalis]|uniref:helix-turn-helix domain-containing protein n=1 Tax=Schaalia hyovaginalis TaxID=29316 RepID=UPI002A7543E2|nr:helix-turn-helix transcriptional regulator [Schaalia hyovaginalis]MDY2669361.1 helix-turn-helix transcriptional regulator [Schaalia hyovaginalis]MDY6213645.1 helix-turn-helix transcriptional regulator [Schaalia hyovaginalis]